LFVPTAIVKVCDPPRPSDIVTVYGPLAPAFAFNSITPLVVCVATLIERIFGGVSGLLTSPPPLSTTGVVEMAPRTESPEISFPKIV